MGLTNDHPKKLTSLENGSIRPTQKGLRQLPAVTPSESKKTSFRYLGFFGVRSARTEGEDDLSIPLFLFVILV